MGGAHIAHIALTPHLHNTQAQMPTLDVHVSLGTFALTKDGSQKGMEELAKMVDTNTS